MRTPTITVSIPTYNRWSLLCAAIDSVLAQSHRDFTLLVLDNGSTDRTPEIMADYVSSDPRIVYKRFSRNHGPANNWAHAIFGPKTDLVTLLPDDDVLLSDHLEAAVRHMREAQSAAAYCCKVEAFGFPTETRSAVFYKPLWLDDEAGVVEYDTSRNFAPVLMGTPFAMAGSVFRSAALKKISIFDDSDFAPGDFVFLGQIALQGSILYDPVVRARYRWHEDNHSVRIRGSFRIVAQHQYAIRVLAKCALDKGALNFPELIKGSIRWPFRSVVDVIMALAAVDCSMDMRSAGYSLLVHTVSAGRGVNEVNSHFKVVVRIVWLYMVLADLVNRLFGGWWKTKGALVPASALKLETVIPER